MNNESTIGQKVKNFRKQIGISQMELENAVGASVGSISRIENGRVEATKETLLKIANTLKLSVAERLYLLGMAPVEITAADTARALTEAKPVLESASLAYLLDDKYFVVALSQAIKQFFGANGIDPSKLIGANMIEIVFSPDLKLRDLLDPQDFDRMALNLLSFISKHKQYLTTERWWQKLFLDLKSYPDFFRLWQEAGKLDSQLYSREARTVKFNAGGQSLEFVYSLTSLFNDPRFTLVEYQSNA